MSKIVVAANSIISKSKQIGPVIEGPFGRLFFLYNKKHKWSIEKERNGITLALYPSDSQSIEELAAYTESYEWDGVPKVIYNSGEIEGREVDQTFEELYTIVKEKLYGVDQVLEDIINDDIPF